MFPVGLCEWKTTNVHPILIVMFKTFEAEILKIFKNSPKIRRSYKERVKGKPSYTLYSVVRGRGRFDAHRGWFDLSRALFIG